MATGGGEVMSDEITNIKCSVCAKKNRSREAEKYCMQCKDYYCQSCTDMHAEFPAMSGHNLMDKADFRSIESDGTLPSFPTQRCVLHPNKVVDMFCKDHDDVACAKCIAQSHRTCTSIHCIPEEVNMYSETDLITIKQKINQMKKTMEEIITAKETKAQDLKEALEREVKSVLDLRKQIKLMLDKMEQETIKQLKQEFNTLETKLREERQESERLIESMIIVAGELERSQGNVAQEFVCIKSAEKYAAKAENILKQHKTSFSETIYFNADQSITTFLGPLQQLGKVCLYPKTTLYVVKKERQINVKHASDNRTCRIWGFCLTDDDSVLLADDSNRKLKRINISTEVVKDYIEFQEVPKDVCQTSKMEAAVSFTNNTVKMVSLGEKMTVSSTITMNHFCLGIAHLNGKLFITNASNDVCTFDLKEQKTSKITMTSFQKTRHVATGPGGDKMVVALMENGLIILDTKGNHLSMVKDSAVSGFNGVCSDGSNIFVSGFHSNNVVQFGKDYKQLGQLAKVTSPLALGFDHNNNWLIVTQHDKNEITILELE